MAAAQRFPRRNRLPKDHLQFCRTPKEKALPCRGPAIAHFIDARPDVLAHLHGLVPCRDLFGEQPKRMKVPDWVVPTPDWAVARRAIADADALWWAPRIMVPRHGPAPAAF